MTSEYSLMPGQENLRTPINQHVLEVRAEINIKPGAMVLVKSHMEAGPRARVQAVTVSFDGEVTISETSHP